MDSTEKIVTRRFRRDEARELLELMKGLAEFEGYIDQFRVTEQQLIDHGMGADARFEAYVAQQGTSTPLLGTAVVYVIPWTYDLRPTLVLKELYVTEAARGLGVGAALMRRVASRAVELDCPRVQWIVLRDNQRAATFYGGLGAVRDQVWDSWALDEAAIRRLGAEVS